MPQRVVPASVALALLLSAALLAGPGPAPAKGALGPLARRALFGSPELRAPAAARLRQAGPAGMEAVLAVLDQCAGAKPCGSPEVADALDALDRVCGVRDCAAIRLFWYTDLEEAKAAARAAGKPILSLRLMGRLDEELSCANSRYFRTVFYANHDIGELLRTRFVLHWRSMRPVPRVTVDFGDGGRLERTLTGNSIHYLLDSRGRLLDALPGLYGPDAFRSELEEAERMAKAVEPLDGDDFAAWSVAHHWRRLTSLGNALAEERQELEDRPSAGGLEAAKSSGEVSLYAAVAPFVPDDELRQLAEARRRHVHLDAASRAFLLRKQGVTDPYEAERLVDGFESTLARDEVLGEYRYLPQLLRELTVRDPDPDFDLEAFNLWVYEEVFRTPLTDPWLGLAPDDLYLALPGSTRTAGTPPPPPPPPPPPAIAVSGG